MRLSDSVLLSLSVGFFISSIEILIISLLLVS